MQGGLSGSGRLSHLPLSRCLCPLPGSIRAAKPKAQLWARRGLDGQVRSESGVGLGQEGPQLSHALGLILPKAPDSDQTGHSQDAKRNSLQGAETQGQGPVPSAFLSHPPSGCLGCFPQVL